MASSDIVADNQLTPLIGAYLPPYSLYHLIYLEEALSRFTGRDPFVLGDTSADIIRLSNPLGKKVVDFLAPFRMVDLLANF